MKLTLNKLFSYLENDGIFNYLDQYDVPWKSSIDTDILNLDYHTKNGEKVIGPAVKALLTEDGLDTTAKQKLAKLIFYKNQVKWDELWRSQDIYDDFDVLDNVNEIRDETTIHTGSDSKTQNIGAKQNTFTEGQQIDSFSKGAQENTFTKGSQSNSQTKGEETLTEGAQSNTIGTHTDSKTITKSAYNSASYSPDTKEEDVVGAHTDSIGQKVNTNSSRSDSQTEGSREDSSSEGAREDSTTKGQRIDTTQEGAQQNTETGTDSFTDTLSVRRHGNIGVTTSGQLIRDFRQTVDFSIFETVYNDINEILVLNVYGDSLTDFEDYTIETNYHLPIASTQTLGGIKVGENLTIASDGTLNAQASGGGAVDSVNGKTGEVTLDYSDVGAASASDVVNIRLDINQLQGSVLDLRDRTSTNESDIVNIKLNINQLQGSVLGLHNELQAVRQVPTGGTEGQVLTKGASGYDWANPSGSGILVPYTLKNIYLQPNDSNGYVDVRQGGSSFPGLRSYVFDVSNYKNKKFSFYAITKKYISSDLHSVDIIPRHRFGFIEDIDLDVANNTNWGYYLGCKGANEQTTIGSVKIYPIYDATNIVSNGKWFFNRPFNAIESIIPDIGTNNLYFIACIDTGLVGDEAYENRFEVVFKVLD